MSTRCLVIGGSGYVGEAVVKRLQEEGCEVVWTSLTPQQIDSLACDLGDPQSIGVAVTEAASQLGGLDAVVLAAGAAGSQFFYQDISSAHYDRLGSVGLEELNQLLETNARGSFLVCQAAAPYLKQQTANRGPLNVVLLAAIDGLRPVPAPVHFATSQAAVRGLVESLAKELGHFGVCVNLLAIGLLEGGWADNTGQKLKDAYLTHCSLKRFGKASEVAEMVAWLVVENTYLTGQTLVLDGGL